LPTPPHRVARLAVTAQRRDALLRGGGGDVTVVLETVMYRNFLVNIT